MPKRYASACNMANKLVLSTPIAEADNEGLYCMSDVFDGSEFSVGFRFYTTTLTPNIQYLLQNTDSTKTKTKYWEIYVTNDGKLVFSTALDGGIQLFSGITTDTLYSVWIDAYEETLNWYIYNWTTKARVSDTTDRQITNAANSILTVLNNYENNAYLHGSLFDLVYVPGLSEASDIYLTGGCAYFFFYGYWPMREGSGAYCNQLIQRPGATVYPALSTGGIFVGGFSWDKLPDLTQDNARRWS